jgi:hypothetical protein
VWTNPRYRELTGREPPGHATAGAHTTGPPAPTGTLLARFPRKGPDGGELELRVVLDAYEGHEYIAVRIWQRDQAGAWWPMKGKGLSIRLGEAEGVAAALQQAIDLVGQQAAPQQRTGQQPAPEPAREATPRRRQRPAGRQRWDEFGSPPAPRGHDEFDEFS